MGKAIPYDQFILRNGPKFSFLFPWSLFTLFCPGITDLLWWVGEGVDLTSDICPSWSNTCVTLILSSLYGVPEAPQENWQMLIFLSQETKAQGKALNACPGFLISPWCRKFKGFSYLIFYLPQSTSWHIWSETSGSWYFFPRLLSAGNPSPGSFPSAHLFTLRLIFTNSSSSKEFGKHFLQTSPRPVPQYNSFSPYPTASILQESVFLKLFFFPVEDKDVFLLIHSLTCSSIHSFMPSTVLIEEWWCARPSVKIWDTEGCLAGSVHI